MCKETTPHPHTHFLSQRPTRNPVRPNIATSPRRTLSSPVHLSGHTYFQRAETNRDVVHHPNPISLRRPCHIQFQPISILVRAVKKCPCRERGMGLESAPAHLGCSASTLPRVLTCPISVHAERRVGRRLTLGSMKFSEFTRGSVTKTGGRSGQVLKTVLRKQWSG